MSDLPPLPTLEAPRGELRRAALLQALGDLLAERPLGEISTGQIAARAGLTRSAFYFYFASKEAAVTVLLHALFERMVGSARAWIEGTGDPGESVGAAIDETIRLWRTNRPLMLAMLDARGDVAVRELWESWIELFVEPLAQAVDDERRRGRAPTGGADAPTVVRLLLGMNERAIERHVRRGEDQAQAAALSQALTQTWLRSIYGT